MFTGFTDETVDFMWGIRFNNERSWFEAHKEIYLEHFYRPMTELADEIYAFLREQRPDYGLVRKVTRIYRDARRLHGRGPYKESLWFTVEQPSEQWTARPVFWFELMPEGWILEYHNLVLLSSKGPFPGRRRLYWRRRTTGGPSLRHPLRCWNRGTGPSRFPSRIRTS